MAPLRLSPPHLNNRGVLLLESGRYQDAAHFFRKASELTISSVIAAKQARGMRKGSIHDTTTARPTKGFPKATTEPPSSMIGFVRDAHSKNDNEVKNHPAPLVESPDESPTTRKREAALTPNSSPRSTKITYSLGRPMWIQPEEERQTPLDLTSLTSTLLYNLGLSFNMIAIKKTQQDEDEAALPFYRKALEIYKRASNMIMKKFTPLSELSTRSPVIVALLHNMSQIHAGLEEREAADRYQDEVTQVLRAMMVGASFQAAESRRNDGHYEILYIQFLSLPKAAGDLATAA